MICPHSKIGTSLDRWSEAHWNLHQIEKHYHFPEPFRYSFNAFLRVIKEVYQILKMDLQNEPDFKSFIKPLVETLRDDALFSTFSKQRDFVVHQGMLDLRSSGTVGSTRGRGIKIGFGFNVLPTENSDDAFRRYAIACRKTPGSASFFGWEDEELFPCIERVWLLNEFGNRDLLELAIEAWRKVGEVISKLVVHFGGEPLDLTLSCGHAPEEIRLRIYSKQDYEDACKSAE